jgi:ferric-dicitrate binding protein FerR (iron transport regulator)
MGKCTFVDGDDPDLETKYPWLKRVPPEWQAYHLMRARQWKHQIKLIREQARFEAAIEDFIAQLEQQRRDRRRRALLSGTAFALLAVLVMWAGSVI